MPEDRHLLLPLIVSQIITKTVKDEDRISHYQIKIAEHLAKLYNLDLLTLVKVQSQSNSHKISLRAIRSKFKTVKILAGQEILQY